MIRIEHRIHYTILGLAAALLVTAVGVGQDRPEELPEDVRYGLLTPLPDRGGVPPIVDLLNAVTEEELAHRAKVRDYEKQLRILRRQHFGRIRAEELRQAGLLELREFTDPAAFRPMIEVMGDESDDVRLAMLDHFANRGDEGQAALAYTAIVHKDDALRNEAMQRLTTPASPPVLRVFDMALRSNEHRPANNAGTVASVVGAVQAIPLLIFGQVTEDAVPEDQGDLAWIAIGTQQAYVANLQPVVGDNSGAYQPILGRVTEGIVLRVMDAVVVVYRTEIHRSLVNLSTQDWGQSTEHLGYDMKAWWLWYNNEYVPYKNEQARIKRMAEEAEERGAPPPP